MLEVLSHTSPAADEFAVDPGANAKAPAPSVLSV